MTNAIANEFQTQLQILTAVVKLFLKRPEQAQGLVQRVLQAATAENDNPDIRDRAYVYWRLLSSDPQVTKNIVLSERPPITSTIQSLPPALLDELLKDLSTLASVYHKPPSTFLGQGRFASDAVQQAAIEEQQENARDNPIAAAAAAAAVAGDGSAQQDIIENLLDFDADGAMPASLQKEPMTTALDGQGKGVDDLADIFGNGDGGAGGQASIPNDLMNGFANMGMGQGKMEPPPPQQQLAGGGGQKSKNDLLDLF